MFAGRGGYWRRGRIQELQQAVTQQAESETIMAQGEGNAKLKVEEVLFCPWGNGKGKINIKEEKYTTNMGQEAFERHGPEELKVDNNGDIYIYIYDGKNKYIKKFEDGQEKNVILNPLTPQSWKIDEEGSIIITNGMYELKTEIYDKNLNKMLSKTYIDKKGWGYVHFYGNEMALSNGIFDKSKMEKIKFRDKVYKKEKKYHSFDITTQVTYPDPMRPVVNEKIIISNLKNIGWDKDVLVLSRPGKDDVGSVEILHINDNGDIFICLRMYEARPVNMSRDSAIMKINKNGIIEYEYKTIKDDFIESDGSGRYAVDDNDNVYYMYTNEKGVHVIKISEVK